MKEFKKKNVIFIVIDSLRNDSVINKSIQNSAPYLKSLSKENFCLSNLFSAGCPTVASWSSMKTSTLPLDSQTYLNGVKYRPNYISTLFQKEKYHTRLFVNDCYTNKLSFLNGYSSSKNNLYNSRIRDLIQLEQRTIKTEIQKYPSRKIELINAFKNNLIKLLNEIEENKTFKINLDTQKKVRDYIKLFNSSNYETIQNILNDKNLSIKIIIEKNKKNKTYFWTITLLFSQILKVILFFFQKKISTNTLKAYVRKIIIKKDLIPRFRSAGMQLKDLSNWIDQYQSKKPFFVFLDLLDIHELNFFTHEEKIKEEYLLISNYFKSMFNNSKYHGNILYDLSVKYTDYCLEKFFENFKKKAHFKDSVIIITADHGHYFNENPKRKKINISKDFYDELYHIPFIMVNSKNNKMLNNNLCSSIDILPTLLKEISISIPEDIKGKPIDSNFNRDYILMENLGPGLGGIELKPIRVCVRTKEKKLVYEYNQIEKQGVVKQCFDLKVDPLEKTNLSYNDNFEFLLKKAQKRLKKIVAQFKGDICDD